MREAEQRKKDNRPPILNEHQMLELAKQDPSNDIFERDELILGESFQFICVCQQGVVQLKNSHKFPLIYDVTSTYACSYFLTVFCN